MSGLMFQIAVYVPLTLALAVTLAAVAEPDLKRVPARAARFWASFLAAAGLMVVLVAIAQDPWLVAA